MKKAMVMWGLVFLMAVLVLVGCSSGGSSSGGDSNPPPVTNNQFVGSWAISDSTGTVGYLYIESNNAFVWADIPDKTRAHFSGTGSVTIGTFRGSFTNPGVGTGDLVCTIAANGAMSIDFIEHWHSPDKHVPYTGRKL